MQSYFRSLSDTNGELSLLDDAQVGEEDVGSFSQISLQNSTTSPTSEEQVLQNQQESFADEEDLFICGRCKQQFTDIQMFLHHKRECIIHQRPPTSNRNQGLPMMQIQQLANEHMHQRDEITEALPNAAILISGQQTHSHIFNTSRSSNQRLGNPTGLNLTQEARKDENLSSAALRNTMDNMGLMTTGMNQVDNLVQFQSNGVDMLQDNMNFTARATENPVLSDDILLNSSPAQNDYAADSQINRLQQNEVNQHQLNALGISMVSNNSMASLLHQINPIQQQSNYTNGQQQVYLHIPQQSPIGNQKNFTLQPRELSNAAIGLNLSAINLTPLTVTAIQDDPLQNSSLVQNLSKQPTENTTIVQTQQQIPTPDLGNQSSSESVQKMKSPPRKFNCQFCNKTFTRGFDREQHVRSHTGEKPFQCIVCGRAFSQKSNVKKHMSTHKVWPKKATDIFPQLVVIDKEGTDTEQHAEILAIDEPPQEKGTSEESDKTYQLISTTVNSCPYCNQVFNSYKERKSHMLRHKDKQVYKCVKDGCDKTYTELDDYVEHVKEHNGAMTYRCHHCHKVFDSLHNLGVHQYQAHLNDKSKAKSFPGLYCCRFCPKKFSHPEFLQIHMKTESHNHSCLFCLKRFSCERYLRKHVMTSHSQCDQKVKCETCGKELKSIYYLRAHMLIHTKEKPFKCMQCDSSFNRKDKLKRHMTIHEPTKKYKCPLRESMGCTKEFNRRDKLKAHIICHNGVRPHKCSFCSKRYTRKCFKVAHERTHTGEFQCQKCHINFQSEKKLEDHKCKPNNSNNTAKAKKGPHKNSSKGALLTDGGTALPEGPMYAIRSGPKLPFLRRKRKLTKKALATSTEKINVEIELPRDSAEEFFTEEESDVEVDVESNEDVIIDNK